MVLNFATQDPALPMDLGGKFGFLKTPYQGPDDGTSHCPQCKEGNSRPTSWSLRAHTMGSRMTDCV